MITQEQIEQAASQIYKDYINYDNHYSNAYTYRQLGFIAGAQWALEQDQWVAVNDGFPKDSGHYLTYENSNTMYFSWYNGNETFFSIETGKEILPSHWQPSPQKPKL